MMLSLSEVSCVATIVFISCVVSAVIGASGEREDDFRTGRRSPARHDRQLQIAKMVGSGVNGVHRTEVVALVMGPGRHTRGRIGLDVDTQPAPLGGLFVAGA